MGVFSPFFEIPRVKKDLSAVEIGELKKMSDQTDDTCFTIALSLK